jgi:5,10-methylenetetrahydrofolate reductase
VTTATLSSADQSSAVRGFSIESVPQDADRMEDFRAHVPASTRVYNAWPPKATPEAMVAAARKIREQGMVPVPHIAARRVPSGDFLRAFLQDLVDQAQITEVLVIGGDPATAEGPYPDTASSLRSGVLGEFSMEKVGAEAHPEAHPG